MADSRDEYVYKVNSWWKRQLVQATTITAGAVGGAAALVMIVTGVRDSLVVPVGMIAAAVALFSVGGALEKAELPWPKAPAAREGGAVPDHAD